VPFPFPYSPPKMLIDSLAKPALSSSGAGRPPDTRLYNAVCLAAAGILVVFVTLGAIRTDLTVWLSLSMTDGLQRLGLSLGQTLAVCGTSGLTLPLIICLVMGLRAATTVGRSRPAGQNLAAVLLGTFALALLADLGFLHGE
jgi:hypothetical protein